MSEQFGSLFRQSQAPAARAKFLSRVFGIFSEEIVRLWASDPRAPYEDLGRPTLWGPSDKRGHTLDFAMRNRASGKLYVAEMKCEIEYRDFGYFVLERADQVERHKKPAFVALLRAAVNDPTQKARISGKAADIDGAMLIWGAASEEGRRSAVEAFGFHAVLTIADICKDLTKWNHAGFSALIDSRRRWNNELFDGLVQRHVSAVTEDSPPGMA